MKTKSIIVEILKNCGLYEGEIDQLTDKEFIDIFNNIDSLELVNFVVEIENAFSIEYPEDLLILDNIPGLDEFIRKIEEEMNQ